MKKIGIFLSVAALVCLLAIGVSAKSVTQSGTCGDNLTWTLDSEGTLVVSGTGRMDNYGQAWGFVPSDFRKSVKWLIISEGVENIGACAFLDLNNLTQISLPEGLLEIGYMAFGECTSLTQISLPEGLLEIGSMAFGECTSLSEIKIPKSVVGIDSYSFWHTRWEENQPDGLMILGDILYGIKGNAGFTNLTVPQGIRVICSDAFRNCDNVISISLPESIEIINCPLFYRGNNSLKSINIPSNAIFKVNPFPDCRNLENIYVSPDNPYLFVDEDGVIFDADKKTLLIFPNYKHVSSYTIPDTVETIAPYAFSGNPTLREIHISSSVKNIESAAFSECTALSNILIPGNVKKIGDSAFSFCPSLTSVGILYGVEHIGSGAFSNCYSLSYIYLPTSIRYIGYSAFHGSDSLSNLEFPYGFKGIGFEGYNDGFTTSGPTSALPISGIRSIRLPNTVGDLSGLFSNPDGYVESIETIYFCGSEEEWNRLNNDENDRYSWTDRLAIGYYNYPGIVPNVIFLPIPITVYLNNYPLIFPDQQPVIVNDRTLVPLRTIFEALGASVTWNEEANTAIAVRGETEVSVAIGSNVLTKNGEKYELDVPTQIIGDRTMVPLRAVSEAFGCKVEWVDDTQTVLISE